MKEQLIDQFDEFTTDKTIAAITMRQNLKPVEGYNAVIFPPTYADVGYNIDSVELSEELKTVCTIDSVGSQANRMEPIFQEESYSHLVPQVKIEINKPALKSKEEAETSETVSLLEAGHRIADAVVRFSNGAEEVEAAFQAAKKGDVLPLAKLAPTSLVFGCWDSRGSSVKLPRLVRSTIRAYNVYELKRYSQYFAPVKHYEEAGVEKKELEKKTKQGKKKGANLGFYDNPGKNPGGVVLDSSSQIIRDAVLSLTALRSLRTQNDKDTLKLRRYLLGLSLIAFTAPQPPLLRMGCELTADPDKPSTWEKVMCDGTRTCFSFSHEEAKSYAQCVAEDFKVGESKNFIFDKKKANEALKKGEGEDA